jgi:hypothetical protein
MPGDEAAEPNGRITTKQFYDALIALKDEISKDNQARADRNAEMERRIMLEIKQLVSCREFDDHKEADEADHLRLETRINGWSTINSIGVVVGTIIGAIFGPRQ